MSAHLMPITMHTWPNGRLIGPNPGFFLTTMASSALPPANIRSTHTPSEEELPSFRQIFAKHSVEVDTLSLEIPKMEPGVPVAKDENAQSALPTPIALVPFEVLAQIFQACVPEIVWPGEAFGGPSPRR